MAVTSLVGRQSSCIIPRVDACRLLCRPRPAFIDFSSSSSPVCLTQSKNTIGRSSQAIYPSKVVDNLQSYSSSLSCSPHCNLVSKSIPALDPPFELQSRNMEEEEDSPNQACCSPWTSMASPKSANLTAAPFALLANSKFSGWSSKRKRRSSHI